VKWLNDFFGRPDTEAEEREEDERAIKELRTAGRRVGVRTERIIEAYERAEARRRKKA
jgi:hypothetical protein